MSQEYESDADRRDQEQSEYAGYARKAKNTAQKAKNVYDKVSSNRQNKTDDKAKDIDDASSGTEPYKENERYPDDAPDDENHDVLSEAGDIDSEDFESENINTARSGTQETGEINKQPNRSPSQSSTSQNTVGASSKTGAKEAGKETAKEGGKEVAKEGAKKGVEEGTKAAAAGAASATGVGAVAVGAAKAAEKVKDQVKQIGDHAKHAVEETAESTDAEGKIKKQSKKKPENSAQDNTIVKLLIAIFAILLVVILVIIIIIVSILFTIAAPVIALFQAVNNGFSSAHDAWNKLNGKTTYQDIAYYYQDNIKEAMTRAFEETCYNETMQIAEEQDYDIRLTQASFRSNSFPYVFEGENCNVNYLEILTVMSMNEKYNILNYDYDEFMAIFEDEDFLRSLYDLKVERAEYYIYDNDEYDEYGNLIHEGTGEIIDTIIYGKVTINRYPLQKLFDYFEVEPGAANFNFPTMTNYQALSIIEQYTQLEADDIDWGSTQTSRLYDYTMYTGEITKRADNIYAKEMYRELDLGKHVVSNGVPVYSQSDPRWGEDKYGSKNLRALGCCLTSMSMVTSYFSGQEITPHDMVNYINDNMSGSLYRADIASDFGFHQYETQRPFTVQKAADELITGRLLIVHIKAGHLNHSPEYGHYVVVTGVDTTGEEAVFSIADPAGGKTYTMTASEAAYHLDNLWSYGY